MAALLYCEHRKLLTRHRCYSENTFHFPIEGNQFSDWMRMTGRGLVIMYNFHLVESENTLHLLGKWKMFSEWCLCQASNLLCSVSSRAETVHGTRKLEAITVVEVPATVFSSFHMDQTSRAHAYLHWSKLD